MNRRCVVCGKESVGLFTKKKRCYYCGGITERKICKKLPDVEGFYPKKIDVENDRAGC